MSHVKVDVMGKRFHLYAHVPNKETGMTIKRGLSPRYKKSHEVKVKKTPNGGYGYLVLERPRKRR